MKIHSATLINDTELVGIFNDTRRTFQAGAKVTAIQLDENIWHLNAELDNEMYDGYANTATLNIGEIINTVNEG